ncbi:DUF3667 domain-containing protein [Erythrobacter crassostreae]|uniref:DUF3667 domain-containing protein n=1 Tax=Erythrobacter crassostreae TaxID=2828328 RepID=A0A9X1F0U2_9SPHN|nr:DUF3667 domain-containing protein [Erythrobacter crassostrea]MBV7258252.1 DUF3667 domain-containing protein [Erythrobacter crassostrea]
MSDITDGIGVAIEGALSGRAVEPKHGEGAAKSDAADRSCLNCGARPTGDFCQNCGQKLHVHRTLSAIGHDLVHGVLHLDGKFWRTIPLLLFKPGKLTRRYIDGERAKFVSPMAMFLFGVFAMFAAFQFAGLSVPTDLEGDTGAQLRELAVAEVEGLQATQKELIAELEKGDLAADARDKLQAELNEANAALKALEQAQGEVPFLEGLFGSGPDTAEGGQGTADQTDDDTTQIPLTEDGKSNFNLAIKDNGIFDVGLEKWQKDPSLMLYKLQTNAYKFSWLLIPISIPFVWLLFAFRRRFRAYDHAIFVTYSISFMSLLFIALSLVTAAGIGGGWVFTALVFIPPLHLYKQLRGTYEVGRFGATWRLLALSIFIWIVIVLFLQALLLLGAL